jgi:hypothetical protein
MKVNVATLAVIASFVAYPVAAEGDLSRANVIDVVIEVGSNDDEAHFNCNPVPNSTKQAGQVCLGC